MADTEFGQYRKDYQREAYKNRLKKMLLEIPGAFFNAPYESKDSIGTLRSILSPSDTLAYPPNVLNTPVYSSRNLGAYRDLSGIVLGDFNTNQKKIRLASYLDALEALTGQHIDQYRTLLHEGGHARGQSQIPAFELQRNYALLRRLIGEPYADSLADSLLKR